LITIRRGLGNALAVLLDRALPAFQGADATLLCFERLQGGERRLTGRDGELGVTCEPCERRLGLIAPHAVDDAWAAAYALKLRLKLPRKAKAGAYRLRLTVRDASGHPQSFAPSLRIPR